eukprot:1256613-Pyramimonas_sp.AAC.1
MAFFAGKLQCAPVVSDHVFIKGWRRKSANMVSNCFFPASQNTSGPLVLFQRCEQAFASGNWPYMDQAVQQV